MNDKHQEPKDDFFKVRISRSERDYLQKEANRLGVTLSSLIRAYVVSGRLIQK